MMNNYNGGLDGNTDGMYLPSNGVMQMRFGAGTLVPYVEPDKVKPNEAPQFEDIEYKALETEIDHARDAITRHITGDTYKGLTLKIGLAQVKALAVVNRNLNSHLIEITKVISSRSSASSNGIGIGQHGRMAALDAAARSPSGVGTPVSFNPNSFFHGASTPTDGTPNMDALVANIYGNRVP